MIISEKILRRIVREGLIHEGDVVPVDFKLKRSRKTLTPHFSDLFIFSGDAGQIARVIEMQRDDNADDGGRVVYEQYVKRDDEWIQEPAQTLTKSLVGFSSRYSPYTGTIEHLNKVRLEAGEDESHMERVMADEGFPDYKNRRHNVTSKEYMNAFRKATSTMPSVTRSLSFKDND